MNKIEEIVIIKKKLLMKKINNSVSIYGEYPIKLIISNKT